MRDGEADMPPEMWTQWLHDIHPGEPSPRDAGAFVDAVARGARPMDVLDAARAYARLARAQQWDECPSVEDWLDNGAGP